MLRKVTRHPLFILALLLLIFAGPYVGAKLLWANRADLKNTKTTNRGDLINPPVSITQFKLTNAKGLAINNQKNRYKAIPPTATRTNGKWMLMLLYPGQCDKTCKHHLYYLRQIRIATGKNQNRIERAILTDQSKVPYPETRVLHGSKKQIDFILTHGARLKYATQAGTTYIVDPFGNIMMAYPKTENPSNILKDLKRLLKASSIG